MKNIELNNFLQQEYEIEEAFKKIRTNIMFCSDETKVISFTSYDKHDGKSTVSLCIAQSLSMANKRVLYVDADMRNSMLALKYTNEKNIPGLSHYLSGQAGLSDVIYKTQYDELYVIFSGIIPPNPSELLSSELFRSFVAEARENFDYVIIDTPPIGLVSDATVCISYSDGTIVIVSSGKTNSKQAKQVMSGIQNAGGKLIGFVLNKVRRSKTKYYKYGSEQGYM